MGADFCVFFHAKDGEYPKTWDDLTNLYGFKFQYSDGNDADGTGLMVKNATAFYMNSKEEVLKEWIILFEKMMVWRVEEYKDADVGAILPDILIHNETEFDIGFDDAVEFKCRVGIEPIAPGSKLAVRAVDVPPPVYPKRMVVFAFQSESGNHVDLTVMGNCKPFASELAAKRVPVKKLKKRETDVYFDSFYVIHDYKIDTAEKKDYILEELMKDVFGFCPIYVKVSGGLRPHSPPSLGNIRESRNYERRRRHKIFTGRIQNDAQNQSNFQIKYF